jgi:hypothetical protein
MEAVQNKAFIPGKTRTKAFNESARNQARRAGLILLFDGEVPGWLMVLNDR